MASKDFDARQHAVMNYASFVALHSGALNSAVHVWNPHASGGRWVPDTYRHEDDSQEAALARWMDDGGDARAIVFADEGETLNEIIPVHSARRRA
jgi:hypothetical protein